MTARSVRAGALPALLFLGLVGVPGTLAAQGTLAGTAVDANTRRPLTGVQISIANTALGALTDSQGRFQIQNVPVGEHQIRALFIGYGPVARTVTVSEGQTTTVDFELEQTAISLDEVVVTATGEQRKRELGHTLGRIEAEEIVRSGPINTMSDLLQGRMAGVSVANSAGSPGMGSRIRIRGSNSISLSNEPLVYIDGIRVESGSGGLGLGGQDPSRFDDINPEDIESIEVVKGPAAATLYGTEAANGVLRITTKRGRGGDTRWSFWAEAGAVTEPNDYPLNFAGLDASGERCLLDSEARGNCVQSTVTRFQILDDPVYSPISTGIRQQYGLSVSGGTQSVNYYVSAELEDEEAPYELPSPDRALLLERGIRINEFVERPQQIERVNLRANLNAQLAPTVNVALRTGYLSSDLSATGNDNNSFGFLPSAFFGGADPSDPEGGWGFQRPAELFGRDALQKIERFTTSATTTVNPLAWLNARATVGVDYTRRNDVSFFPRDLGVPGQSNLGRKDNDHFDIFNYSVDVVGTASFNLNDRVSSRTSVGTQWHRRLQTGTNAWGIDIVNGAESIGAAAETFSDETTTEDKTLGVFIEQQLGWNDRLFVTGAVRADDNSAFGRDYDLIYYPKFSLSWLVTEEPFFPRLAVLDQLRLRGAWGSSGLQPGSTAAIRTLDALAVTDPLDNTVSGVAIGEIGNALLEPEQSSELELGLDADLFSGRLGLEFTYYNKRSEAALIEIPLAPSLGASQDQWINIGEVRNRGFEFGVNASVLSGERVAWDVSLSGSINENELLTLGEGVEPIGTQTRHVPGYPLGGQWARPILGFDDADGNGIIDRSEVTVGDELEFIGPGLPEHLWSVSSGVTLFNRLRIQGLVDYRGDYVAYNNTERFRCRFFLCQALIDRETPLWDQARAVASLLHPSQTVYGYIEDADNWKLRELAFSFLVPEAWTNAIRASRASITLTGRNLATWTDYSGMDPEINSAGTGQNFGTSEFLTQAPLRYWTVRFNLSY